MTDTAYSITLTGSSLILALLVAAMLASPTAHAARPMITDDARIVDAKACQLETWMQSNRDSIEYWALPACNFTGNLELTLGGARTRDDSGTHATDVVFQGKTLFKPLEPGGWGIGLGVGMVRHLQADAGGRDGYAYVPASFSFRADHFLLHTNIGWLREQEARRDRFTWGPWVRKPVWRNAPGSSPKPSARIRTGRSTRLASVTGWRPTACRSTSPTAAVSVTARKNTGFPLDCACSPHDFCLEEPT